MEKEVFNGLVDKLILPLFTGTYIIGEEESSSRDSEVALGKQNTLLIKPNKADEYRIILKRGRPFQQFETSLLKTVLKELNDIDELNLSDKNYKSLLQQKSVEKAMCESLSTTAAPTILGIISELTSWADRTYEGKKLSFGIIINQSEMDDEENSLHYSKIFDKDFFALLSDGEDSFLEFDRNGYLMGYNALSKTRAYATTSPNEFEYVARYCNDRRIGIVLTKSGDLLIFKNRILMFAKRRGTWNVYSHEEVIQLLSYKSNHSLRDLRRSIYFTALDCSFEYTGGILVYLNKDMAEKALSHVDAKDILDEKYYEIKKNLDLEEAGKLYNVGALPNVEEAYSHPYNEFLKLNHCDKAMCMRKIIDGRKFQELNRKLREELVGMDGATIIDFDGTIITVGAILKIEAGSSGGGRLAATMNLAKYGVSIKISQDGEIQGFSADKKGNSIKQLFTVN